MNRVFILLLILQPTSLPYHHRASAVLLVLLIIAWLVTGNFKKLMSSLKNPFIILFISLAIIPVISLVYSSNIDFGLLEKRAALLFYPLVLYTSDLTRKNILWILYGFSLSCTVASAYVLVSTIYNNEPFSTEMAIQYLGVTHVFLSLFISFAIVILGYLIITKEKHDFISILVTFQIIFLLFFMFALGGKMSIISLILLSIGVCMELILKSKRWKMGLLFLLIPTLTFLITINNIDVSKSRFAFMLNPDNYFAGDNAWNSVGVRVSILKCTFEVYKQTPIIQGTGIGDVQNDLNECYENSGFPSINSMNTHNQYLQVLLGTGVVGLILFFVTLFYPAIKSYREKNSLYLLFIFIFSICCLTESLLERQQGVMFFAFFNSLLFFHGAKTRVTGD